mmetsp:Transcript_13564/g.33257  ORF Transcript_13564/g.33257 Transcript_13564/m.33257 type:complete len:289 (-) Transcript_13564:221-1087(-)
MSQIYAHPAVRLTPVLTGGIALFTIIVCVIITTSQNVVIGGLSLPYVSDTGRDGGAYYLFATGLTIAAFFLELTVIFVNQRLWVLQSTVAPSMGFGVARYFGMFFGLLGPIGLAILAIVNTKMSGDLHAYAAYLFFACQLIYCITVTSLISHSYKRTPAGHREKAPLRSSWIKKSILIVVISILFVIYLPVGLAIVCEWVQDPITEVYDYTGCTEINHMRSASQHLCIYSMLLWLITLYQDMAPSGMTNQESDPVQGIVNVAEGHKGAADVEKGGLPVVQVQAHDQGA